MTVIRLTAPGVDVALPLDNEPPTPSGGGPAIEEVARIDNLPLPSVKGGELLRQKVPVLLDGFADDLDQQPLLDQLLELAVTDGEMPEPVRATGPIQFPNRLWYLESLEWGASDRNDELVLVRQALTLSLVQFEDEDVLRPTRHRQPTRKKRRTYTTKKGDTLLKIATRLYGRKHAKDRAKQIGKLNKIRDIRKPLKPGRELRLPGRQHDFSARAGSRESDG